MTARISPPFSYLDAIRRSHLILSQPPAQGHIRRVDPVGELVNQFALPLDLCKPQNRTRHSAGWALGKLKTECFKQMWIQNGGRKERAPLPGRPMVRAVRFSSVEPDRFSDWAKVPIDRLCVGKMGLGYLRNDRPKDAQIECWWEPGPKSDGWCLIEVWTGEP